MFWKNKNILAEAYDKIHDFREIIMIQRKTIKKLREKIAVYKRYYHIKSGKFFVVSLSTSKYDVIFAFDHFEIYDVKTPNIILYVTTDVKKVIDYVNAGRLIG